MNIISCTGPARVFDNEVDALNAILVSLCYAFVFNNLLPYDTQEHKIKKGDVLVIRYEGPKVSLFDVTLG